MESLGGSRPVVIAHRGASGLLPEHSLPGKVLAAMQGADFLEQDVVATRDGELLVIHDIHLDRTTDVALRYPGRARGDGRFYAFDFAMDELRALELQERVDASGQAVYPGRCPVQPMGLRLHTLAEELRLVRQLSRSLGRTIGIYPEIKKPAWHRAQGCDIGPQVAELLAHFGYAKADDPCWLQCFDPAELMRLRARGCQLRMVQLLAEESWRETESYDCDLRVVGRLDDLALRQPERLAGIAEYAQGVGPWLRHLLPLERGGVLTAETQEECGEDEPLEIVPLHDPRGWVEEAHRNGLEVHAYTFRPEELPAGFADYAALLRHFTDELGVDGLFCDYPGLSQELLSGAAPAAVADGASKPRAPSRLQAPQ